MGGPADKDGGIVWLVNGEERPFEPLEETRRPWLEESTSWGEPAAGDGPAGRGPSGKDDDASEPPQLVWL